MEDFLKKTICQLKDHVWENIGGRPCPKDYHDCSQIVYECSCGAVDYGDKGGPAYKECYVDCLR